MIKRIAFVPIAVAIGIGVAACGSGSSTPSAGSSAEQPASSATAVPAGTGDPVAEFVQRANAAGMNLDTEAERAKLQAYKGICQANTLRQIIDIGIGVRETSGVKVDKEAVYAASDDFCAKIK
ncbi:hypothetical protein CU254_14640 [Amycolatopsis sp. AA4]|uniref:hypothetical protein n=1 Tax=Actinomycetes TaxID=1760 RepID=UPI0001B54ACB|nr:MULTISPECIES: hypothetical protein [Actinomycetes]ATY11557.1 hypothetical protein CU254_14640 [Amycolatopsis sp. AA4]EFL07199.1 predicted protein [Streptomyces sp. AA4]